MLTSRIPFSLIRYHSIELKDSLIVIYNNTRINRRQPQLPYNVLLGFQRNPLPLPWIIYCCLSTDG